eukprot:scaffold398654_cov47-Attheya_sp.AAC.1
MVPAWPRHGMRYIALSPWGMQVHCQEQQHFPRAKSSQIPLHLAREPPSKRLYLGQTTRVRV